MSNQKTVLRPRVPGEQGELRLTRSLEKKRYLSMDLSNFFTKKRLRWWSIVSLLAMLSLYAGPLLAQVVAPAPAPAPVVAPATAATAPAASAPAAPNYATPTWLNHGDTCWQLIAATIVGMQSIPGLAILYGGVVKKKWAINSAFMVFYAFAAVLIAWLLWAYNMGFGPQWFPFVGHPTPVASIMDELNPISRHSPRLRFPCPPWFTSSLCLPPSR
jgi:hypothetical protein